MNHSIFGDMKSRVTSHQSWLDEIPPKQDTPDSNSLKPNCHRYRLAQVHICIDPSTSDSLPDLRGAYFGYQTRYNQDVGPFHTLPCLRAAA